MRRRPLGARIATVATLGLSISAATAGLLAGCSDDPELILSPSLTSSDGGAKDSGARDSSSTTNRDAGTAQDGASTSSDASGDASRADATPGQDASPEAGTTAEAGTSDAAAEAGPVGFCQGRTGLAFCADYDQPGALTPTAPGGAGYDAVVTSETNLTISTGRAVSTPSSLLVNRALPTRGDAKVVKTVTGAVAEATYEFDLFLEKLPVNNGGFITDFQFNEGDTFGFRIAITGNGEGGFERAQIEHNRPGFTPDRIDSPITLKFGEWTHVKLSAAFSTVGTEHKVHFQAYLDRATTPVVDGTYDAPFAAAPFARVAQGVVFPFNGDNEFTLSIDNTTLEIH